jgi:DnaK suppressor protein
MGQPDQEMNMNAPLSDTFRIQLVALRADTVAQLRAQRGGAVGRAESAANALASASDDQASADAQRSVAFALEERESAGLVAIDAALQRIVDGSYGLCVDCGVSIPTARQHANPVAMRCVDCQTTLEMEPGKA